MAGRWCDIKSKIEKAIDIPQAIELENVYDDFLLNGA
jgi:hypothetical protein